MDGLYVGNGYRIKRWDTCKARQNNDGDTFAVSGNTTVGNVSKESGKVDSGEANLLEIFEYCRAKSSGYVNHVQEQEKKVSEEETETDTEVIVRPDGSRVLVVTVNIGGTSTTMSMKISEPTEMPNEAARVEEEAANAMESDVFASED